MLAPAIALLLGACGVGAHGDGGTRYLASAVPECRGAAGLDFECHRERYEALVTRRGARAAIADLLRRRTASGYLRAACHQLMHVVGRAAARRHGIRALERGDAGCSSGYYHGVVEAVTGRIGGHDVMREGVAICARYRQRRPRSLEHYNCAHGMGHGFMDVLGNDVPRALAACETLPAWEGEHCEGGVFMENLTAMDAPDRPPRSLRPEQPLYPCTAVAARFKGSCYLKQTAYPLLLTGGDFGAVFALCAAAPDVAFRPACYRGLGGDAVIRANKYVNDPADVRATIRALCHLGPEARARRECVVGAVTVAVKDAATRTTNLPALCASFGEADLRSTCARTRAHLLEQFGEAPATAPRHLNQPALPARPERTRG